MNLIFSMLQIFRRNDIYKKQHFFESQNRKNKEILDNLKKLERLFYTLVIDNIGVDRNSTKDFDTMRIEFIASDFQHYGLMTGMLYVPAYLYFGGGRLEFMLYMSDDFSNLQEKAGKIFNTCKEYFSKIKPAIQLLEDNLPIVLD